MFDSVGCVCGTCGDGEVVGWSTVAWGREKEDIKL